MGNLQSNFKILKAFNGDSILIKSFTSKDEEFTLLIDGGTSSTFSYTLKKELIQLKKINIVILTHIDSDHIGGLINFFKSSLIDSVEIDEIWINSPELIDVNSGGLISYNQAKKLKDLILEKKPDSKIRSITTNDKVISFDNIKFTILSPTPEILNDLYAKWPVTACNTSNKGNISFESESFTSNLNELSEKAFTPNSTIQNDLVNASSIAFLLECSDLKILLLSDSRAEIIHEQLIKLGFNVNNKIVCDYVKISHHGSKNNTSNELLSLIESNNFIISTNGGSTKHRHPSRETIARIIYNKHRNFNDKIKIFINYPLAELKQKNGDFINEEDLKLGNWNIEERNNF